MWKWGLGFWRKSKREGWVCERGIGEELAMALLAASTVARQNRRWVATGNSEDLAGFISPFFYFSFFSFFGSMRGLSLF